MTEHPRDFHSSISDNLRGNSDIDLNGSAYIKFLQPNQSSPVWKSLTNPSIHPFVRTCMHVHIGTELIHTDWLACVNTLAFRIRGVSVRRPRFSRVQHSLSRWLLFALGLLNATQRPNKLPPSAATVRETVSNRTSSLWTAITHDVVRK